ncbi:MAG TPA: serine/threonine-protein kinase [Planctomycetota bacterium]|nr:serine/threonine-protein kinase [Planctomycetota bacterium]
MPDGPAPRQRGAAAVLQEGLPKTIGDFRIAQRAGAGAMGEVYLATHRSTGEEAAIKVVSPRMAMDHAFVQRFQREIEALIALDHPNIARAIAYGLHDMRPWLAMEFVRGPDLADLQRKVGALPEDVALRLAMQIARGLDHVHATAGLIHRDIKPSNILVAIATGKEGIGCQAGEHLPKIIDFGLAKSTGDDGEAGLTQSGAMLGTPYFMSPEQIRNEPDLDLRTDIYALGGTLFRLLTDRVPYEGTSQGMILSQHLTAPVPDPRRHVPGLHGATAALVMKALAKEPDRRFPSHAAFIAACEVALAGTHQRDHGTVPSTYPPLVVPGVQPRQATLPVLDDDDPFAVSAQRDHTMYVPHAPVPTTAGDHSELDQALREDHRGPVYVAAPTASELDQPATRALRRGLSERIQAKQQSSGAHPIVDLVKDLPRVAKPRPPRESAVYRRVPEGRSLKPFVVLAISLAAFLLYLALH